MKKKKLTKPFVVKQEKVDIYEEEGMEWSTPMMRKPPKTVRTLFGISAQKEKKGNKEKRPCPKSKKAHEMSDKRHESKEDMMDDSEEFDFIEEISHFGNESIFGCESGGCGYSTKRKGDLKKHCKRYSHQFPLLTDATSSLHGRNRATKSVKFQQSLTGDDLDLIEEVNEQDAAYQEEVPNKGEVKYECGSEDCTFTTKWKMNLSRHCRKFSHLPSLVQGTASPLQRGSRKIKSIKYEQSMSDHVNVTSMTVDKSDSKKKKTEGTGEFHFIDKVDGKTMKEAPVKKRNPSKMRKNEGKYSCDTEGCGYRSKQLGDLRKHCLSWSHNSAQLSTITKQPKERKMLKGEGRYSCDTESCAYRTMKIKYLRKHCKNRSHFSSQLGPNSNQEVLQDSEEEAMVPIIKKPSGGKKLMKGVKKEKTLFLEPTEADYITVAAAPIKVKLEGVEKKENSKGSHSRKPKNEGKYTCDTKGCEYRSIRRINLKAHCMRKSHQSSHLGTTTSDTEGKMVPTVKKRSEGKKPMKEVKKEKTLLSEPTEADDITEDFDAIDGKVTNEEEMVTSEEGGQPMEMEQEPMEQKPLASSHICKICSFVPPREKNKGNQLRDHIARKHFLDRIKEALPAQQPYLCPEESCDMETKDWQVRTMQYRVDQHVTFPLRRRLRQK